MILPGLITMIPDIDYLSGNGVPEQLQSILMDIWGANAGVFLEREHCIVERLPKWMRISLRGAYYEDIISYWHLTPIFAYLQIQDGIVEISDLGEFSTNYKLCTGALYPKIKFHPDFKFGLRIKRKQNTLSIKTDLNQAAKSCINFIFMARCNIPRPEEYRSPRYSLDEIVRK